MNPITNTRNQMKMNERELELGLSGTKSSWHMEYKDSAWVFIGGMPYELSEGDMICMFSQYGEVVHVNLVRDHNTGKSRGFGFLCFEDQRSTNLAVDNLNAFKILNRLIRVDHVHKYKLPKDLEKLDDDKKALFLEGCAPKEVDIVQKSSSEEPVPIEDESKKKKKKRKKTKKKKKREKDSEDSDSSSSESEAERRKKKKRDERRNSSSSESEAERRKKKSKSSDDESSSDSDNEGTNRRMNDNMKKEPSRTNYDRHSVASHEGRREKDHTNDRRQNSDRRSNSKRDNTDRHINDRREDSDRRTNDKREDSDRRTNDRRDDSDRRTNDRRDDSDRRINDRREDSDAREDSDRHTKDRRDDSDRYATNRSDRHYDKNERQDRKRERSRDRTNGDKTEDYRSRK